MALLIVWSFGCCSFQGTEDINGVVCSNYDGFLSKKKKTLVLFMKTIRLRGCYLNALEVTLSFLSFDLADTCNESVITI